MDLDKASNDSREEPDGKEEDLQSWNGTTGRISEQNTKNFYQKIEFIVFLYQTTAISMPTTT